MINTVKTLIAAAIFFLACSFTALNAKSITNPDTLIAENGTLSICCAPCAGTPAPGATTSTLPSPIYTGQSFTLGYANPCGEQILHSWQKSSDGTTWVTIPVVNQATYTVTGMTSTTWYRCILKCTNSNLTGISLPIKMTFNAGTPPCTGTPTPGATTCSPAPSGNNGATTFTFALQNATSGSGVTYQWQGSPNGTSYVNFTGATQPTFQKGNITQLTYFRCIVTCTASGKSANSVPVIVPYTNGSEVQRQN